MNNKFRQGKVLGAIAHVDIPGVASHRTLYLYSGKPTKQFEPGSLLDANAILDLVHGGAGDLEEITREEVLDMFGVSNICTIDGFQLTTVDNKLLFVNDSQN